MSLFWAKGIKKRGEGMFSNNSSTSKNHQKATNDRNTISSNFHFSKSATLFFCSTTFHVYLLIFSPLWSRIACLHAQ